MLIRYQGGDFKNLIISHKKFIWLVYVEVQLNPRGYIALKPSWIEESRNIPEVIKTFPNVIFVESLYDEVLDELIEMGYSNGDLWDDNNGHHLPIIVGMDKGWKKIDSLGKCYCIETLSDIIFQIYPEELNSYLNQPV